MAERVDWTKVSSASTLSRSNRSGSSGSTDLYHTVHSVLDEYADEVRTILDYYGSEALKALVSKTRDTAPRGSRLTKNGGFRKRYWNANRPHLYESISGMRIRNAAGHPAFLWYVRAPNNRIAHLVEHGYWRRDAGFGYSGSHFVRKAAPEVQRFYLEEIEQALGDAGYEIEMKYSKRVDFSKKHRIVRIG